MKIKYARANSYAQSLGIQFKALKNTGCEKISGVKEYGKQSEVILDFIREDNPIVLTKFDRLIRTLFELQKCSQTIKNKRIDLPLLNIIGMVAEFEREMINRRVTKGRKVAREKGIVLGKKCKLAEDDVEEMAGLIQMGIPKPEIAELFNIGRISIFNYLKK